MILDWTNTPSYLALCDKDIYRLELTPLLTNIVAKFTTGAATNIPSSQSVIHHLLMFAAMKVFFLEKNKLIYFIKGK